MSKRLERLRAITRDMKRRIGDDKDQLGHGSYPRSGRGSKNPNGEKRFITANEGDRTVQMIHGNVASHEGEKTFELNKYAVWGDKGRGKPEVLETSNDLARMQHEHDVPNERVVHRSYYK